MTSTLTTIAQKLVGAEQAIDDLANKSWYDVCEETEEGEIMTVSKPFCISIVPYNLSNTNKMQLKTKLI